MNKILHIAILIVITQCLHAQFAGVFKDSTFTRLDNNLAILAPDNNLRGTFQWQKSSNLNTWTDTVANITGNAIAIYPQQTAYYRLKVTEDSCSYILYTDTAKVYSQYTTVSEYLAEEIPVPDLFIAGVSVAELVSAGVPVSDLLAAGISVSDLFNGGILVGTLEQNGVDSLDLANAGLIGIVTDTTGYTYKWIRIGEQYWMAENLKTTKYNNGTGIPLITDNTAWSTLTTPGFSWYNNDGALYGQTYGALYNWHTVNTGNLCPSGWHVPTYAEWTTLTNYLGGESVAGGKLKETGTTHWNSPNTGATNKSGFTALPGGYRGFSGTFYIVGDYSFWWSATGDGSELAKSLYLRYDRSIIDKSINNKVFGYYVRCVRN